MSAPARDVSRPRRSAVAVAPGPGTDATPHAPITPEKRAEMIAVAAYYRAEHRGCTSGYEVEDWLAAESEIDAGLARAAFGPLIESRTE